MARSDHFADLLAASLPADRREQLQADEERRIARWLEHLTEAAGRNADNPFTRRQERAAVTLIEGAGASTLTAVANLLRTLSER